jgi:hypothetical protein
VSWENASQTLDVIAREGGQSSTLRLLNETLLSLEYWIARSRPGDDIRERRRSIKHWCWNPRNKYRSTRLFEADSRFFGAVVPIKQNEGVI